MTDVATDSAGAEPAPKLSVAAPCYNEADAIGPVLAEWDGQLSALPYTSEIVLCNDGSTDDTSAILAQLQQKYPRLRVVDFAQNGGYGRALCAAIDATRGEYVATIDSDGQFDLGDAPRLLEHCEQGGLDCVTGFRVAKQDSLFRVVADRGLNKLVKLMFGTRLTDTNCALKVARGDVLRGLGVEARGFPTPTEICLRLEARGCKVDELGVAHREREAGASKLHPFRTAWGMFRFLLYLRKRLKLARAGILSRP